MSVRNGNFLEKSQVMGSGLGLLKSAGTDKRFCEKCEIAREDRNCTEADSARKKRKIK